MNKPNIARLAALSVAGAAALGLAACGNNEPAATTPVAAEASVGTTAQPTTEAPLTGDLASLQGSIGKYPNESGLFDNSVITGPLQNLLGSKYDTFKTNMQVQSPLIREGNVLYVSGNKQHEGGSNAAYLLIDTATKALEVGLWENGKLTTYPAQGSTIVRPADIQTLIDNAMA